MRISIVEDNQMFLTNLELLLSGEPNYEIIGAFLSAEDAMLAMQNNPPDVLLTDLDFPGMSGIELIGKVKNKYRKEMSWPTLFPRVGKVYFRQ